MNIRIKRYLLSFIVLPLGFFPLLIFRSLIGDYTLLLMIIYFFSIVLYIKKMKCPQCKYPLGSRKIKFGEKEYEYYSIFTKEECENCGYKF